jgi:hypothetical protein
MSASVMIVVMVAVMLGIVGAALVVDANGGTGR